VQLRLPPAPTAARMLTRAKTVSARKLIRAKTVSSRAPAKFSLVTLFARHLFSDA